MYNRPPITVHRPLLTEHHMKLLPILFPTLLLGLLTIPATAEERTLTPAQMEALAKAGELVEAAPVRPATLPDLTKGDPIPEGKTKPQVWTLGPTGIAGIMVGKFKGDPW